MNLRQQILPLIFTLFILYTSIASASNQTCGAKTVQYPFGFSDSFPIRLHCNNSQIVIDKFQVQNLTPRSIFIELPANCSRSIDSIKPLFTENYAVTWQNSLLLQNCGSQKNGCVIPTSFVQDRLQLKNCDPNISCFPQQRVGGADFMSFKNVNGTGCKLLLSSITFDSNTSSSVSLEFQKVELVWWLDGPCRCSENSNCIPVNSTDQNSRFRCECDHGFEGDGYSDGQGCRKVAILLVSRCKPTRYLLGRCGGTNGVGVLIGGIVAAVCITAGLCFLCCFIRRRLTCLKNKKSATRLLCEAAGNNSIPLYPYKEIERATNFFSEKQRLGTGAFGMVYAGKLHNDEWVAIKKIKHRDTNSIDQVLNEIKLLSSVSHPNLVRLLGCCIEEGEQILVYEYMRNGTLSQHLQREGGKGLPWTIRLTIAAETAHAIAYLHSTINPPIYHRDIKSSNILLDCNYKSKVADFGLSRLGMMESSHVSTAPQGTPGYLDPQYHHNFHLSDRSDVYSFGVVLVEIITALKVVDFARPQSEVNLAALAIDRIGRGCVDEIIDPFLEPHRDAWTLYSVHKVAELAFRCLAFHSDMRPSMMEVAEELELIRRSGWATFDDNMCMTSSMVSSCSSPRNGSEKSMGGVSRKTGVGSQRLIVPQKVNNCLASMEEVKDSSPVSVHDPWLSEQSSPSADSLLGNVIQ